MPAGGWGGASRARRIAAGLQGLEAARLEKEAARRAAAREYLAAARDGRAPRGGVPAAIAVEVAELRLERAVAADAGTDARYAAAGRGKPGRRRGHGQESARARLAREQLAGAAAARRAREREAAQREEGPGGRAGPREAAGAGAEHHRPGLQGHALHPAGQGPGL